MTDCVFCAIVAGTAPASIVYEDDHAIAFLDLFPVHSGHTLVVPKRHVHDLSTCDEHVAGHLMRVCAMLAPRVVRVVGAAGFNVWTANGFVAGQEVFHLHFHILPRFEGDGFGLRFPRSYPQEADRNALEGLASEIRKVE